MECVRDAINSLHPAKVSVEAKTKKRRASLLFKRRYAHVWRKFGISQPRLFNWDQANSAEQPEKLVPNLCARPFLELSYLTPHFIYLPAWDFCGRRRRQTFH